MALKLLAFLAVFKLALSVSDPEPNSSVNIDIKQLVNGGAGCGGNGCCAKPACPEEKGFFFFYASGQCFKFLKKEVGPVSWEDAETACEADNLKLAHPYDAVALRSFMVQRFGQDSHAWVDAKGNGFNQEWQDNGEIIPWLLDPLWFDGTPTNPYCGLESCCVSLLATAEDWKNKPDQVYWAGNCSINNFNSPLCELV